MDNYELLESKITDLFEELNSFEPTSDEYSSVLRRLETLYKLKLEEMKIENDCSDKTNRRIMEDSHFKSELELKDKQLAHNVSVYESDLELKNKQLAHNIELGDQEYVLKQEQLSETARTHTKEHELKEQQLRQDLDVKVSEMNSKERQSERQKINDYLKIGIEVAGIVLPLVFYGKWMKKGLEFEETGTFTSNTFKGLVQKFKPTK